jgi:AcrR family transcriptional regulator
MMHAVKQQQVRDAISTAAVDLFCSQGYEATTVDDIAQSAGVSRRSFFRYFSSKDEVIGQVIRQYGEALAEAIAAAPRTYSPMEVLRDVVLRVSAQGAADPHARQFIRITQETPAARQALLARHGEVEGGVARAYEQRLPGTGNRAAARLLASVTLSVVDVAFLTWYEQEGAEISEVAESVIATLTQVITPP